MQTNTTKRKVCNKEEAWRKKVLKELETIIQEDWGDEPQVFEEEDLRSQAWKALTVLYSIYEQSN